MAFGRRETAILIVGDLVLLVASLWMALFIRNLSVPTWGYFELNLVPFLPMFLLSLGVFYIAGLYEKQTRPIRRVMGVRVFGAQGANVLVAALLFFVLPLEIAPKTILILYLVVSVVAVSSWRFYRMKSEMKEGNRVPAVLVGSGKAVADLYDEVDENSRYLIRFVSKLDPDESLGERLIEVTHKGVRAIVVDTVNPVVSHVLPTMYTLAARGVSFIEFSALHEEIFDRVPLEHFDVDRLIETLPKRHVPYTIAKRVFDITLALSLSVVALPLIMLASAVLGASGGSPFVQNARIGKGGRVFDMIKLRTMTYNDHGDPALQQKNRVTPLGQILRKTRIDELPQLWNVLKGEVSFIGPRPELPKIAEVYEQEIPQYQLRHLIAPGLSGWAQIHDADVPKGPADVVRTKRKLSFDLYYLKHRSFGLDLAIAFKTVRTLLAFSGK